ncbi:MULTISPECIES: ferredoxin [Streptomyces]|uniref:Ferredoxin n=4 Tax=Streptomyces TaxID=1883 RepID=A0A8H9LMV6_9ACTN|nr:MULTISPECIES: ferredoxin [Streptomyces]NEE41617.1 ferredoxin [Streptomyces sp. SID7982]NEE56262.1 ferredoxin [Streptomyces sp. SID8455]MBL3808125.1 ferredoxin [Streptomyces sp. BRB081]MDQ0297281.1 ferredoxin [Streptomyces sp. DSM 41037]NEC11133.1 ferredoxin [Streptomyces sp. SID8014]
MRVTVDKEQCVGAGQCVLNAPDVFDQDDDGVVVLLREEPDGQDREAVRTAGDLCPSASVTVHED